MSNKEFQNIVIKLVKDYTNEHMDKTDNAQITEDDVFIVWMCKTLQNHKALASTTVHDGMYYEITYNGEEFIDNIRYTVIINKNGKTFQEIMEQFLIAYYNEKITETL
jgi:hypothetical protein